MSRRHFALTVSSHALKKAKACAKERSSFTLIELLIVIAIVSVLSVVVILTLNPAELLKQARDSTRLSDLSTLNTSLNIFNVDKGGVGYTGNASSVYISVPDTSLASGATSTCTSLGLPSLPSGYSYYCVSSSSLQKTDGTGWIPVNFQSISAGSPIPALPKDPINTTSSGSYYTYMMGGSWLLTGLPESTKQKALYSTVNSPIKNYPGVMAFGNNFALSPLYSSVGLIGYWTFDEGTGSTAVDSSGSSNSGSWVGGGSHYTAGKVGAYAGQFNGTNDYITLPALFANSGVCNFTLSAWSYDTGMPSGALGGILAGTSNGWANIEYMDTSLRFELRNFSAGNMTYIAGSYAGSWMHTVLVLNNGVVSGYINGSKVWDGGNIGCIGLTTWTIGSWDNYFKGLIDDARVYNRALSAGEIQALYNATR